MNQSADIGTFPALFTKVGEKACSSVITVEYAKKWGKQDGWKAEGGRKRLGYPLMGNGSEPPADDIAMIFLNETGFLDFQNFLATN